MSKSMIAVVLAAVMVGALAGFLWWGVATDRLKADLQALRANTDRLSQQLDDLRKHDQEQKTRLEATERDLRAEREMNSRLHLLVSQGKK